MKTQIQVGRLSQTPGQIYNLCELVNGVREELGLASLRSGHYTQMRLIIGRDPDDGINKSWSLRN
jgi:hypothetical protein